MTKDEEIISNISYVNSDFRTIYPQLLDTAKKLTNKWDPSLSNESDPGNILIKEAAIVADKNNYHVDKNVLECFPLSATQQASARQIYDLVGYRMHWYRSAKANINFTLTTFPEGVTSIHIDAGTQVTDTTGNYIYTTLKPLNIMEAGVTVNIPAIQGTIIPYEVNGESIITIDKLDDNNRLYFPQNVVAENGIYVYDYTDDTSTPYTTGFEQDGSAGETGNDWVYVDNLTKYSSGSKVFTFGVDLTSDNCYIEFPEDILTSGLIQNGIMVYYTITAGEEGTIKSEILSKFVSDINVPTDNNTDTIVINSNIIISNTASTSGENIETLNSAYRNYKKLIGTYDTLVSRRDYENAIYNLNNDDNTHVISNDIVADRTTDLNYSQPVIVNTISGNYSKNFVKNNILNSYDIVLYLFKESSSMQSINDYDTTFTPDISADTLNNISFALEDNKSIQHDLKTPSSDLWFNITNLTRLNGVVTTYYKVTQDTADEIQANINQALISTYNTRELTIGDSLDYSDIINTIKTADDRIRDVSLDIPRYEPYLQYADGTSVSLYSNQDATEINNTILAKMILAGRVQLFNFNTDFNYYLNQTQNKTYEGIKTIQLVNDITIPKQSGTFSYKLQNNDIIQILTPRYNIVGTLNANVKIAANFNLSIGETKVLGENDKLKFIYKENNVLQKTLLTAGAIIDSYGIAIEAVTDWNDSQWNDTVSYTDTIKTGQSINILKQAEILINNIRYRIISNAKEDSNYKITVPANSSYILKSGEYLFYSSDLSKGIIYFGEGTAIKNNGNEDVILTSAINTLEDILSSTSTDIVTYWNILQSELGISENNITALSSGYTLLLTPLSSIETEINLKNTFTPFTGSISYTTPDEEEISLENTSQLFYLRSTFALNSNNETGQTLVGNQTIIITTASSEESVTIEATNNPVIMTYPTLSILGGDVIDLGMTNPADTSTPIYTASLYTFILDDEIDKFPRVHSTTSFEFDFSFATSTPSLPYFIIPVDCNITEGGSITLSVNSGGKIGHVYGDNSIFTADSTLISNSLDIATSGTYYIAIQSNTTPSSSTYLTVTVTGTNNSITLYGIKKFRDTNALNVKEINCKDLANDNIFQYVINTTNYTDIINIMNGLPGINEFDATYIVPNESKVIQPLIGESYFNPNHICNMYTLAKIDLGSSTIKINPSSIE